MGVKKYLALFALLSGFASTASADGIIYIGGGSAETASTTVNGDTPMSGVVRQSHTHLKVL
jgi:hypothetical protein